MMLRIRSPLEADFIALADAGDVTNKYVHV
jgi:hypothetical protein